MSSKKFNTKRSNEIPDVGTHHDGSAIVYMMHKISKLRELNTSDVKTKSDIFAACIIFVNGVTNPPVEELRRLVSIHGGECVNYRVSGLTHFVCDYFTDAQLKHEYSKKRINNSGSIYNVTAQWIVDSIRDGRRLDEISYLPYGLQAQLGRPITNHFVKAAEPFISVDNEMNKASSSMKPCASSTSSDSSSSSSSSSSRSGGGIRNKSNDNFENGPNDNSKNIRDYTATIKATNTLGTATTNSIALDSPSALGLTLSQEDFIRSVPLDEFQDDIFEQLIQFNLSKKAAKQFKNSGSDGIAASEKRPGVEEDSSTVTRPSEAMLVPFSSNQQPPRPLRPRGAGNRDQNKQGLQEMVSWIHGVEKGSAGVVLRLLCYTEQLIHSFSGYTRLHRHPQDEVEEDEEAIESALCLPGEYHYGVLQSYGVWLLHNDQLDNLTSFIRQLRKVCRTVTAEELFLGNQPLQRSYFEWQKQWGQVPLQVEEHIQRQAAARFNCKIAFE